MMTNAAMRAGFSGGLVVDYPHRWAAAGSLFAPRHMPGIDPASRCLVGVRRSAELARSGVVASRRTWPSAACSAQLVGSGQQKPGAGARKKPLWRHELRAGHLLKRPKTGASKCAQSAVCCSGKTR